MPRCTRRHAWIPPKIDAGHRPKMEPCGVPLGSEFDNPRLGRVVKQERRMNGLIYLIGLIVVIMAILSFFGLR